MTGHSHENPWAGQGSVLLDIGGDVGALVVEMPSALVGVEVEVRPAGTGHDPSAGLPHVAVVERPTGAGTAVASLVFPELRAGCYELVLKGEVEPQLSCVVNGGAVSEVVWGGDRVRRADGAAAPSGARDAVS